MTAMLLSRICLLFSRAPSVLWRRCFGRMKGIHPIQKAVQLIPKGSFLEWEQADNRQGDGWPRFTRKTGQDMGISTHCWMKIMKTVVSRIYTHDKDLLQWAFKPDRAHHLTQSTLHTAKKILHKKQQRQPNNNASIQCLSAACLPLSTI